MANQRRLWKTRQKKNSCNKMQQNETNLAEERVTVYSTQAHSFWKWAVMTAMMGTEYTLFPPISISINWREAQLQITTKRERIIARAYYQSVYAFIINDKIAFLKVYTLLKRILQFNHVWYFLMIFKTLILIHSIIFNTLQKSCSRTFIYRLGGWLIFVFFLLILVKTKRKKKI